MTDQNQTTVTVDRSQARVRPDGGVEILLVTKELGTIAIAVTQESLAALRRDVARAGEILRGTVKNI